MIPLNIIKYCAEEVERQHASPVAVWWMCDAWSTAALMKAGGGRITSAAIELLGKAVNGYHINGFRDCPVTVGTHVPPLHRDVPRLIAQLTDPKTIRTPEEFYREFQQIHPFVDGNGRTGKILYNWLKNTLEDPIMPPNFWGISNP